MHRHPKNAPVIQRSVATKDPKYEETACHPEERSDEGSAVVFQLDFSRNSAAIQAAPGMRPSSKNRARHPEERSDEGSAVAFHHSQSQHIRHPKVPQSPKTRLSSRGAQRRRICSCLSSQPVARTSAIPKFPNHPKPACHPEERSAVGSAVREPRLSSRGA